MPMVTRCGLAVATMEAIAAVDRVDWYAYNHPKAINRDAATEPTDHDVDDRAVPVAARQPGPEGFYASQLGWFDPAESSTAA